MKRRVCLIICIAALLLAASVLPVHADSAQAVDLTRKCSFDFGDYRSAEGRVLREPEQYQIFRPEDSFSFTWEEAFDGARLCLTWQALPEGVAVLQYDADGVLLCSETLDSFYETITPLLPDARKAVVQSGKDGMRVRFCSVYGAGELPEPFHEWNKTPERVDYLLISTHPDDDVLFMGCIIPTYGAEQGYIGSIVYVTRMRDDNNARIRASEAENAAWTMGLRSYPVFLNMPDVTQNASKERKSTFRYDELLQNLVRVYRRLKPLVVFAQDENGEYGHWQHKLVSKASREAFALAADPTYDPDSAEQYGTWQVQKLFLHLYPENRITVDAHAPLSFFGGRDAFEVACEAYKKHKSQQRYWFKVERDKGKYPFNHFGMAEGVVPVGEDVFDNIDETLFCGYVPSTPEPTAEPTPEPTPVHTPEPTPEPTREPTPKPDPAPATSEPAPQAEKPDPTPLILTGAITSAAAIAVGVAAYFWKKRRMAKQPSERE